MKTTGMFLNSAAQEIFYDRGRGHGPLKVLASKQYVITADVGD